MEGTAALGKFLNLNSPVLIFKSKFNCAPSLYFSLGDLRGGALISVKRCRDFRNDSLVNENFSKKRNFMRALNDNVGIITLG